jgi:hypothetical protein
MSTQSHNSDADQFIPLFPAGKSPVSVAVAENLTSDNNQSASSPANSTGTHDLQPQIEPNLHAQINNTVPTQNNTSPSQTSAARKSPSSPRKKPTPAPVADPALAQAKLKSIRQEQDKAVLRIKLGSQLLKAAETQASQTMNLVEQLRTDQQALCGKMKKDAADSITHIKTWSKQRDQDITERMDQLESRMVHMQSTWEAAEQRLARLVDRSETMFDQSRLLLEKAHIRLDQVTVNRRTTASGDAKQSLKVSTKTSTDKPQSSAASTTATKKTRASKKASSVSSGKDRSDSTGTTGTKTKLSQGHPAKDETTPPPTKMYQHMLKKLTNRASKD